MQVIQLCHDYAGPFPTVARQYAAVFEPGSVTTIFLKGAPDQDVAAEIPGDVSFLALGSDSFKGFRGPAVRAVCDATGNLKPQVIIAHRYKPFCTALQLNHRLRPERVLGVMHEYGFLGRSSRALYARFWPDNVHLAGVSAPLVAEVSARLPGLAGAGRLHLVGHGLEGFACLDPAGARHAFALSPKAYCFGAVTRLIPKKNPGLLLDALAGVDEAVLVLVGEGELEPSLRRQAEKLGLGERLILAGQRDNARRLMTAFDALVLPSTREEAFGLVLLEAVQAGLPIICSDVPGPRSVLGDAATYFASDDVLDLRRKMKQQMSLDKTQVEEQVARLRRDVWARHSPEVMQAALRQASGVTKEG